MEVDNKNIMVDVKNFETFVAKDNNKFQCYKNFEEVMSKLKGEYKYGEFFLDPNVIKYIVK